MASFTPALAAAALYAGINALLLIVMAARVIRLRNAHSLSLGDGDGAHPDMTRAMRAHGNAAETMPLALILIVIAALAGAPAVAIHALGVTLTAGRALHFACFLRPDLPLSLRVPGMALTFLAQGVAALGLIAHGLGAL